MNLKNVEGSHYGLYNVKNSAFSWMNWGETCKSWVRIAEIQTW